MGGLSVTPFDAAAINDGVGVVILTIPLALAARWISGLVPLRANRYGRVAPVTLIRGGLRGGTSIALALGLPDGPARSAILAAT